MSLKDFIKSKIPKSILNYLKKIKKSLSANKLSNIDRFEYKDEKKIKDDIYEKYDYEGPLLDLFINNRNQLVHKWHHYLPLYERYFKPFQGDKKIRFLEIGVSKGGSLNLWRKFFGDEAIIYGIDINPLCSQYNGLSGQVRIGSQDDERFLKSVIDEMGGVDIILDDGSHQMKHIKSSLRILFPRLSKKGIYIIEDLHSAYWKDFGGGYASKKNFFTFIRSVIDDMHHWYHNKSLVEPKISEMCSGIHIHDSITVLEKNENFPPVHSKVL